MSKTTVAIGAHDSARDGETMVKASKFIIHPNYQRRIFYNDIALVKLESPVDFDYKASPICLPTEEGLAPDGSLVTVAGWGVQSFESKFAFIL